MDLDLNFMPYQLIRYQYILTFECLIITLILILIVSLALTSRYCIIFAFASDCYVYIAMILYRDLKNENDTHLLDN